MSLRHRWTDSRGALGLRHAGLAGLANGLSFEITCSQFFASEANRRTATCLGAVSSTPGLLALGFVLVVINRIAL
jgi:hypothetical protein